MERNQKTADRVRPIIEAMEQSINRVRRERLRGDHPGDSPGEKPVTNGSPPPSTNGPAANGPSGPVSSGNPGPGTPSAAPSDQNTGSEKGPHGHPNPSEQQDSPPRLKAKPKRPNPFLRGDEQPGTSFRSRAS
ncbi:MAG: hypothetical protein EA377_06680 [Phycisphaerales bacterium]|nr:MAG: hypothetical protein EA377_06680 [Phycisphaerales bacterium]